MFFKKYFFQKKCFPLKKIFSSKIFSQKNFVTKKIFSKKFSRNRIFSGGKFFFKKNIVPNINSDFQKKLNIAFSKNKIFKKSISKIFLSVFCSEIMRHLRQSVGCKKYFITISNGCFKISILCCKIYYHGK